MTSEVASDPAGAAVSIRASMSLVSIFCADHRALATWYMDTFEFAEITDLTTPLFTAVSAGRIALGFHHDDAYDLLGVSDRRAERGTRLHCTFDAGDATAIDAAADRLRAAGASLIKEPFTTYYGARQIVFADPEGNVMRLSSSQDALASIDTGVLP